MLQYPVYVDTSGWVGIPGAASPLEERVLATVQSTLSRSSLSAALIAGSSLSSARLWQPSFCFFFGRFAVVAFRKNSTHGTEDTTKMIANAPIISLIGFRYAIDRDRGQ